MSDIVEKARGVLGEELTLGGVVVECTDDDGLYDVDREDGSSVASDVTLVEATRIAEAFRDRTDLAEEVVRVRTWREGPPKEPGWYWLDVGASPFIGDVVTDGERLIVRFPGGRDRFVADVDFRGHCHIFGPVEVSGD